MIVKIYICKECGIRMYSLKDLKQHHKNEHLELEYDTEWISMR